MATRSDAPRYENRKARFELEVDYTVEAGIQLLGSEVKSLRTGRASINEAFAINRGHELFLIQATIPPYPGANQFNHEPTRPRRLLLHKREINKIIGAITRERITVLPMALYFNDKGRVKVTLAIGKGRNKADKREVIKQRDWNREKARVLKGD
ncbi:MAG: SsrA-binding protein SmpB [Holosporales bacterium]